MTEHKSKSCLPVNPRHYASARRRGETNGAFPKLEIGSFPLSEEILWSTPSQKSIRELRIEYKAAKTKKPAGTRKKALIRTPFKFITSLRDIGRDDRTARLEEEDYEEDEIPLLEDVDWKSNGKVESSDD